MLNRLIFVISSTPHLPCQIDAMMPHHPIFWHEWQMSHFQGQGRKAVTSPSQRLEFVEFLAFVGVSGRGIRITTMYVPATRQRITFAACGS
jgi:hypothetical protein